MCYIITRIENSMNIKKEWLFLCLAFIVFVVILLLPNPEGLTIAGQRTLAVFALTIVLWFTRPVSFPITFFILSVLLVLLGVFNPDTAFKGAGSSTIFFLIGAIILAFALSKYNLDKRIALLFLQRFGMTPQTFLLGITLIGALLSMVMPAHGVVAFLIPIILSVLGASKQDITNTKFSKSALLCLAYGASVGSMGTLLGGARNPLAVSLYFQHTGETVSFIDWFIAAFPLSLIMVFVVFVIMIKVYPPERIDMESIQNYLKREVEDMGGLSINEKMVLFFFILAFILWATFGTLVGMSTVAVLIAALLGVSRLLTWEDVESKLPWGIIFLYGGAITLAFALQETGATSFLARNIINFIPSIPFLTILVIVILTIFLSEVMSNAAATATILPLTLSIFVGIGLSPLMGMYIVALPSAFAFMFIIGTPGSAMVYDTGLVPAKTFVKPGILLNIVGIVLFMTVGLGWWKLLGLW